MILKLKKHEPLGHVGTSLLAGLLPDARDGEAHPSVDARHKGLEPGLGHGVREQPLVFAVHVRVDLLKTLDESVMSCSYKGDLRKPSLLHRREIADVDLVRRDADDGA